MNPIIWETAFIVVAFILGIQIKNWIFINKQKEIAQDLAALMKIVETSYAIAMKQHGISPDVIRSIQRMAIVTTTLPEADE